MIRIAAGIVYDMCGCMSVQAKETLNKRNYNPAAIMLLNTQISQPFTANGIYSKRFSVREYVEDYFFIFKKMRPADVVGFILIITTFKYSLNTNMENRGGYVK